MATRKIYKFVPIAQKLHYEVSDSDTTIDTLEGNNPVRIGDYILTGTKGENWAVTPEKFARIYEDFGNGVCQKRFDVNNPRYATQIWNLGEESVSFKIGRNTFLAKNSDYLVQMEKGSSDFYIMQESVFDTTTNIIEIGTDDDLLDFSLSFADIVIKTAKGDLANGQ
jgi:hypothetical protein